MWEVWVRSEVFPGRLSWLGCSHQTHHWPVLYWVSLVWDQLHAKPGFGSELGITTHLDLSWEEWWCRTIAGEFWVNMSPVIVPVVDTHTCKLITQASGAQTCTLLCTVSMLYWAVHSSHWLDTGHPAPSHNIINIINQHFCEQNHHLQ